MLTDKTVKCWGGNSSGQLGDGTTEASITPVAVRGLINVIAPVSDTCVLLADRTIKCWSYDFSTKSAVLAAIAGLDDVILAGGNCAMRADHSFTCWQIDPLTKATTLTPLSGLGDVVALTGACALLKDSTVKCWGNGFLGQLGNGYVGYALTPEAVSGITNAVAAAAGWLHTCAKLQDGTTKCWGYDVSNPDPTAARFETPVTVSGLSNTSVLVSGSSHICALLVDHTVQCWGDNSAGQLGNGSKSNSSTPVTVIGLSNVTALAAGGGHTCALLTNQTVKCWGLNTDGQIGDGTISKHHHAGRSERPCRRYRTDCGGKPHLCSTHRSNREMLGQQRRWTAWEWHHN